MPGRLAMNVEFEISDALNKLSRLGLYQSDNYQHERETFIQERFQS